MKRSTKIIISLALDAVEVGVIYLMYKKLKSEAEKAYKQGRVDCVDDFVKGFAFTNGKTITIESEHNGSITVMTVR